jgi:hypothetical protein
MRKLFIPAVLFGAAACTQSPAPSTDSAPPLASAGCLPGGKGQLEAELRGAMEADLQWSDAQMVCDGDVRPDGKALRLTVVGPLADGRQLRFIFGIDLADTASGPAQALPTNLTVLVEGAALMYATRGNDKCAVENLERTALADGVESVAARGYCLGPASDLSGESRLLVPTFSFKALIRKGSAGAPDA